MVRTVRESRWCPHGCPLPGLGVFRSEVKRASTHTTPSRSPSASEHAAEPPRCPNTSPCGPRCRQSQWVVCTSRAGMSRWMNEYDGIPSHHHVPCLLLSHNTRAHGAQWWRRLRSDLLHASNPLQQHAHGFIKMKTACSMPASVEPRWLFMPLEHAISVDGECRPAAPLRARACRLVPPSGTLHAARHMRSTTSATPPPSRRSPLSPTALRGH